DYAQVSPGYFRTMSIPLLRGRDFNEQDRTNAVPVTVVNEMFVKNFKLRTNVLGRLISFGGVKDIEIIGVVKDTKRTGLAGFQRGTPAGGNRLVWLAGLQRHATHARDRHPHGARRAAARRAGLGRLSRDAALVIGSRYRAGRRTGPFTRAANVALRRSIRRAR